MPRPSAQLQQVGKGDDRRTDAWHGNVCMQRRQRCGFDLPPIKARRAGLAGTMQPRSPSARQGGCSHVVSATPSARKIR